MRPAQGRRAQNDTRETRYPESFDCHSEPFAPRHPEQREGSRLAQGKLREESQDKLREGSMAK